MATFIFVIAILYAILITVFQVGAYAHFVTMMGTHTFDEGVKASLEKRMMSGFWVPLYRYVQQESESSAPMQWTWQLLQVGPYEELLSDTAISLQKHAAVLLELTNMFSWRRFLLDLGSFLGAILILWADGLEQRWVSLSCTCAVISTIVCMYMRWTHRRDVSQTLKAVNEITDWVISKILKYQIPAP